MHVLKPLFKTPRSRNPTFYVHHLDLSTSASALETIWDLCSATLNKHFILTAIRDQKEQPLSSKILVLTKLIPLFRKDSLNLSDGDSG